MTDEAPQWITEINPGIQEAPPLSRDLVHPVAQGIHVVTVAHQGLQMTGASQDQFIHHNSSGDLTKEDHLQDFLKVREIIIALSPLTLSLLSPPLCCLCSFLITCYVIITVFFTANNGCLYTRLLSKT